MENIINPIIEKPKTNYLNLILISLAFVLFITGAYLLGKQSVKLPETPVTILPQTTAIPTTITDPIANWKTYTDEILRFSLKYPASWVEGPTGGNFRNYMGPDFLLSVGQVENRRGVTDDKPFNTIDEYIKSDYDDVSDKQIILLDGKEATKFKTQNITRVLFFSIDKKTISVIDMVVDINHLKKYGEAMKLFTQILSTFKFTENRAESLGNWVKRPNGDFITNDSCIWLQISKANDNADLEQYVQNFYKMFTIKNILFSKQYSVKGHESITIEATGMEEMFNVFFSKDDKKYGITFLNANQDPNKECNDYQKDIDYVLNNVDLFL